MRSTPAFLSQLVLEGIELTDRNWGGRPAYHNGIHAHEVMDAVLELIEATETVVEGLNPITEEEQNSLVVAAAWHDAIYVPGSISNEDDSAIYFTWRHAYNPLVDPDLVVSLIRKTTIKDHMSSDDESLNYTDLENIILDADLWSLQLPWEQFLEKQILILQENGLDRSHLSKSAEFLTKLLGARLNIYRTLYAQVYWEERASSNIKRLKKEYGNSSR